MKFVPEMTLTAIINPDEAGRLDTAIEGQGKLHIDVSSNEYLTWREAINYADHVVETAVGPLQARLSTVSYHRSHASPDQLYLALLENAQAQTQSMVLIMVKE